MLKVDSDLQENILKPIKWQTDLLLCQINDILDYASFEINDFNWDFSLFYLEDLLQDCISIYLSACKQKKIELKLETNSSEDKQMINNDYKRLKQVIVNLLNNSIKFTQQYGEIVLRVSDIKNNMYLIQVIDTGLGLSQEQLSQLQMNIEQDNQENEYNQFHVGLGLKVANRLILGLSSLKKGLKINSTLNKGTIISFTIEDFLEENKSQVSEINLKDAQISRYYSLKKIFKFILNLQKFSLLTLIHSRFCFIFNLSNCFYFRYLKCIELSYEMERIIFFELLFKFQNLFLNFMNFQEYKKRFIKYTKKKYYSLYSQNCLKKENQEM